MGNAIPYRPWQLAVLQGDVPYVTVNRSRALNFDEQQRRTTMNMTELEEKVAYLAEQQLMSQNLYKKENEIWNVGSGRYSRYGYYELPKSQARIFGKVLAVELAYECFNEKLKLVETDNNSFEYTLLRLGQAQAQARLDQVSHKVGAVEDKLKQCMRLQKELIEINTWLDEENPK